MKRIGILRCLRSNDVCTGAACLRALRNRTGSFAQYEDEELELEAYWSCNGCGDCRLNNQQGIEEKLKSLKAMHLDVVHVGVCTMQRNAQGEKVRCRNIVQLCERLQAVGIKVVLGTH